MCDVATKKMGYVSKPFIFKKLQAVKLISFKVVPIGSSAFFHSLLVYFQTFLDVLWGSVSQPL